MRHNKLLLSLLMLCTACTNVQNTEPQTEYLIPNSLIEFTGTDIQTVANSMSGWNDENNIIDYSWNDDGITIIATDTQRDKLVKEYIEWGEEKMSDLMEENDSYKYNYSNDYRNLNVYMDKKAGYISQLSALVTIVYGLGFAQIMTTGSPEWEVTLTVYNCHTGKEVGKGKMPGDGLSIGDADWEASE